MPNPENLYKMTSEIGRERGIKSGEARRAKRDAQKIAARIMDLKLYPGDKTVTADDVMALAELKGQNVSVREAIIIAQAQNALKGDKEAAAFLINTAGEKPADKVEVGMTVEDYVKTHKVRL
jgi:hypothetical protein